MKKVQEFVGSSSSYKSADVVAVHRGEAQVNSGNEVQVAEGDHLRESRDKSRNSNTS